MIPPQLTSMFLPQMNTGDDGFDSRFPLNIVKAPIVQRMVTSRSSSGVVRILQSRNQQRKNSALSLGTFRIKECNSRENSGVKNVSENELSRSSCSSVRVSNKERRREKIFSLSARSNISNANHAEIVSDCSQEIAGKF